jgi:transcriptional regulator with XRE-family HTH domain
VTTSGHSRAGDDEQRSDPLDSFGAYLRTQRQLAQLTLRQLADLAKISNPYLSQIERGLHQPSVAVIRSLAQGLNLSADALLAQAAGLTDDDHAEPPETEAAIRRDPRLGEEQKAALLSVYRSMVGHDPSPAAKPRRTTGRSTAKTSTKSK